MHSDDIDLLNQLNRDYVRSVQDSDVRRFEEILAPDFVNRNPDGALIGRAAFLAQIARPPGITNLESSDVHIQRVGDVALIHASFEDTRPDGSHGRGRYTDIWQERNGRWLCVSAHFARC